MKLFALLVLSLLCAPLTVAGSSPLDSLTSSLTSSLSNSNSKNDDSSDDDDLDKLNKGCSATKCPSFNSSSLCPTATDLPSVRNGRFSGCQKGAFVAHVSNSLNLGTTKCGTPTRKTTIFQCSSSCTSDNDCEYWTWIQDIDLDTADSGTCTFLNIDQCKTSSSDGSKQENFNPSAKLAYSGSACNPSSPPPPKSSPPPPVNAPKPPPVGVTARPPPPPKNEAPCPPGVKGDPHFSGWDGVHFDFTGRPGQSYCLLSDDKVHINMQLEGYTQRQNGSESVHTWIKGVGVLSGKHTLALFARSGAQVERGSGYVQRMVADGKDFSLTEGETLTVGQGEGAVSIRYEGHRKDADDEIDVYRVDVSGALSFLLKMRPEVPVLRLPDNAWVHFSLEVVDQTLSETPHGILGQTLWNLHHPDQAPEGYAVEYSGVLWAWMVAGNDGEKYIQGTPRDYLTSSMMAPDCKFSRLEGAHKSVLGVFPGGCSRKALVC